MANIFLSIPVLNRPELKMMYTLMQSVTSCYEHRIKFCFNESDSLISRVRNVHISKFYDDFPECDYFISLDSDLEIFNHLSNDNIFTKLVSHDLDLVGGLYAVKNPGALRTSSVLMNDDPCPKYNSGLKEVRFLSTGCFCVKRTAVQKMIESYPELTYDGDDAMAGRKVYGLYIPMIYEYESDEGKLKKYLSEDWSFCQRWRDIGGQIWADTSIAFNHIGKHAYNLYNARIESSSVPQQKANMPPPPGFDLEKNNEQTLGNDNNPYNGQK